MNIIRDEAITFGVATGRLADMSVLRQQGNILMLLMTLGYLTI